MNRNVAAEGVETARQRDLLRDAGCDLLQGYFSGRPQPSSAPAEMLRLKMADEAGKQPARQSE